MTNDRSAGSNKKKLKNDGLKKCDHGDNIKMPTQKRSLPKVYKTCRTSRPLKRSCIKKNCSLRKPCIKKSCVKRACKPCSGSGSGRKQYNGQMRDGVKEGPMKGVVKVLHRMSNAVHQAVASHHEKITLLKKELVQKQTELDRISGPSYKAAKEEIARHDIAAKIKKTQARLNADIKALIETEIPGAVAAKEKFEHQIQTTQ